MVAMIVHGIKVPLCPDDVSPTIWQALASGRYEAKEARWIHRAVKHNDRVLELGTGIGIITSVMAKIPGVRVWAFEANPSTAVLARRVLDANDIRNVEFSQGVLAAGEPRSFQFYIRKDLWMSSMDENQGAYDGVIVVVSSNIDKFLIKNNINVLVMDIEGAEKEILQGAELPGVERIFLELHDHLYGLEGILHITQALTDKGFAYDPRGSFGPCVLFAKDTGPREYEEVADAA